MAIVTASLCVTHFRVILPVPKFDNIPFKEIDIVIVITKSSLENQKGFNAVHVQRCFVENQKGAIAVQRIWR